MTQQKNRKYISPARERQALATRGRILAAAEGLLAQKGFAGMTVAEVARQAGVAPQTVYAVFSSKAGIITAAIEARILGDDTNADTIKNILSADDPHLVLRSVAKLVRKIHERNAMDFTTLYGATLVTPEVADLEKALEEMRLEKQTPIVQNLIASNKILPHLDATTVRDILWTLTGRQIYHLLVTRRNWPPDQYEGYLYTLLSASLLCPQP